MVISSPSPPPTSALVVTLIYFSGKQLDLSYTIPVVFLRSVGLKNSTTTCGSCGTVRGIWQLFVNVFDHLMKVWKKSQ